MNEQHVCLDAPCTGRCADPVCPNGNAVNGYYLDVPTDGGRVRRFKRKWVTLGFKGASVTVLEWVEVTGAEAEGEAKGAQRQ